MPPPLAYFLSWTCYGQRLHGDERGAVDRHHNQRGTPLLPADPQRFRAAQDRMSSPAVTLTAEMCAVCDRGTEALCVERGWRLLAQAVRPTHVHVVVNCPADLSPERAMSQVKARMTRDLRRAGLVRPDARLWARHGSTRWINHDAGLQGAIAYVNDWQTGPNREILEEKKRVVREQVENLRAWLRSQGLPESGRTVVVNETQWERQARLRPRQNAGVGGGLRAD